jgi:hypothetical protein
VLSKITTLQLHLHVCIYVFNWFLHVRRPSRLTYDISIPIIWHCQTISTPSHLALSNHFYTLRTCLANSKSLLQLRITCWSTRYCLVLGSWSANSASHASSTVLPRIHRGRNTPLIVLYTGTRKHGKYSSVISTARPGWRLNIVSKPRADPEFVLWGGTLLNYMRSVL